VAAVATLGQHTHHAADLCGQEALGIRAPDLAQACRTLTANCNGHLRHTRRRRARSLAVREDVQEWQLHVGDKLARLARQDFRLGREAGDQVGTDCNARPQAPRPLDHCRRIGP